MEPELIADYACKIGEGPAWHAAEKRLYWTDIARGRVFCGTMQTESHPGRLYRLDPDGTLTKLLDGIGVSNGMGFTPDRKRMYYTDSVKREIYLFDYNESSGAITNQR